MKAEACFYDNDRGGVVEPKAIEDVAQRAAQAGVPIILGSDTNFPIGTIVTVGPFRLRVVRRATKADDAAFHGAIRQPPPKKKWTFHYEFASD